MSGKISQAQALATATGQEQVLVAINNANYKVSLSGIAALTTKATVGLGAVDNTADAVKPVSTAQQAAINAAQANAVAASAPVTHVGSGGSSHAVVTVSDAGFMSTVDKVKLDGVSGTNTGDETATSIRAKLGVATLSGVNTGDQTSVTGNAGTATALQTPRSINGIPFDGTVDITISATDSIPRIALSEKGAPNGIAVLDGTGKIPTSQLPSYVDDILEYNSQAAFPVVGEAGKIYVTLDTNATYRWSGTSYIQITAAGGGGSGTVDSVAGKTGIVTLVKADVGLGNVDNTADLNKPVSIAQQTAIDAAQANAMSASAPNTHVGSGGTSHASATTSVAGFMAAADKVKLDAISGLNTGDETDATIKSKLGIATLSGVNTGDQTSVTGNAGTATVLQTARTINGVSFNGSTDIIVNAVDVTARIAASEKGAVNGVATLDSTGKVPAIQLPSYVDDVLEYASQAAFPAIGETGKIYVALDTSKTHRWSGSIYVAITSGAVDSVAGKSGVVSLVKADVGLGNVDNTADLAKPISTATQTALDSKAATAHSHTVAGITDFTTSVTTVVATSIAAIEGVNFSSKEW